ncbi:unnamed protein product [Polarella glacialis]|uniref:Uncharacterized protein n=1 Tax=Polarella glacialis TaxID=89957 RepID=A0A813H8Y1_POLGL|nr:unnamed protein product [Polarella glacialis]
MCLSLSFLLAFAGYCFLVVFYFDFVGYLPTPRLSGILGCRGRHGARFLVLVVGFVVVCAVVVVVAVVVSCCVGGGVAAVAVGAVGAVGAVVLFCCCCCCWCLLLLVLFWCCCPGASCLFHSFIVQSILSVLMRGHRLRSDKW